MPGALQLAELALSGRQLHPLGMATIRACPRTSNERVAFLSGNPGFMIWWTTLALAAPPAADNPLSDVDSATWRALSARHAAPCAQVTASSANPVSDLMAVVEHASLPPWAPMRAADCLVRHHASQPQVARAMREWVADPDRLGLSRLVVTRLDELDPPQSLDLARRAWNARHDRPWVARRLERSARPEVRAVAR